MEFVEMQHEYTPPIFFIFPNIYDDIAVTCVTKICMSLTTIKLLCAYNSYLLLIKP